MLAEKIIEMLDESGATEVQKLAALDVARAIVPVSMGSLHASGEEQASQASGFPESEL
jgi:hypothetical protein